MYAVAERAVISRTHQYIEQPLCYQRHELVAELGEFPGVAAHEGIGDYVSIGDNPYRFDVQLESIAVEHERLGRNTHVVLDAVRQNVFYKVFVQIPDLHAVQPVRMVYLERP